MTTEPYLDQAKQEIALWEKEKPSMLQKVGGMVLAPAEKIAEKLIPAKVQENVSEAIADFLSFLAREGTRTFNREKIRKTVEDRATELGGEHAPSLAQRLQAADERAQHYLKWHIAYASTEGAATGSFGIAGLAADIPALLGILLRQIQEIGSCYGYDPGAVQEREYLLHILRAGFASNVKLKMEFVFALKQFEQVLVQVAWKQMAADLAAKQFTRGALLAAIRQLGKTLGIQLTKRKALQMVPVIGAVVGASLNGVLARDVGRTAFMSYRRRWLLENSRAPKLEEPETPKPAAQPAGVAPKTKRNPAKPRTSKRAPQKAAPAVPKQKKVAVPRKKAAAAKPPTPAARSAGKSVRRKPRSGA